MRTMLPIAFVSEESDRSVHSESSASRSNDAHNDVIGDFVRETIEHMQEAAITGADGCAECEHPIGAMPSIPTIGIADGVPEGKNMNVTSGDSETISHVPQQFGYSVRNELNNAPNVASERASDASNIEFASVSSIHMTNTIEEATDNIGTFAQTQEAANVSLFGELSLYNRCHYSLPFILLFLLHFAYEHTSGIIIFVSGTFAIIGLDQRLRGQIDRKENASLLHITGIIAVCVLDIFAICCVNGDPNPHRQFWNNLYLRANNSTSTDDTKGILFWQVLGAILVNDFIVRLCSIILKAVITGITLERWSHVLFSCRNSANLCDLKSCMRLMKRPFARFASHTCISVTNNPDNTLIDEAAVQDQDVKALYAHSWRALFYRRRRKLYALVEMSSMFTRSAIVGFPWCIYYQMGPTQSVADVVTFAYIFMKALVLGAQAQSVYAMARSFLDPKLEFGALATVEDVTEAGSPDCTICYENMNCPIRLPCAHLFCEECVAEWLDREHSCPLCRANVNQSTSNPAVGLNLTASQEGQTKPRYLDGSTSLFPQIL